MGSSLAPPPRILRHDDLALHLGCLQHAYGQPNTDETRNNTNQDVTWIVYEQQSVSIGVVACSYLFVATFATTWGPVSWTYPAEIFPSKVRAKAVSLATSTNWFFNTVLAFAVPPLLVNINYNMYGLPVLVI
jgi:sugar transport protein